MEYQELIFKEEKEMGYILSEESKELVKAAKQFAEGRLKPVVAECDRTGEPPMDVYKEAFDLGYNLLEVPEEYGGLGLDYYTVCAIYEEFAKVDLGFCSSLAAAGLALKPVIKNGTPEQIQYFADFLTGDKGNGWSAFALTEPDAGSDAANSKVTAVRDGDEFVINGRKCFCTNAGFASIFVVFAVTDKSAGVKGLSAFIVEADRPGLSIGKEEDKMGIRLSNTTDVVFDDVRIPAKNMLGKEGKGFKYAMETLDLARPVVAAMAVGLSQRCIEESVSYTKARITFGKPVIKNQVTQFKLADMEIKTEAARACVINCFNHYYAGLPFGEQAAIAKCFAGDVAVENALEAIQMHGGYGYSREYPVEKLLRDAKILQIYEGTNEVQRIVVAGNVCR